LYIEHRLLMAGGEKNAVFTAGSHALIARLSRGIPRRINAICDRALLIAYGRDLKTVDRRLIRAAIRDIGPGYLTEMDVRRRAVRIILAMVVAAALLLAAWVSVRQIA
jgi:general secretion pathway protein A